MWPLPRQRLNETTAHPAAQKSLPSYVYLELNDRQTNKDKSNLADTTL